MIVHVSLPADECALVARTLAEMWLARVCDRGGFFHVVEVWVEGAYLVEILDPTFRAQYRRSMTIENWKAHFGA